MRYVSALLVVLVYVLCGQAWAADAAAPRPNIVFIMADDLAWGDFQCYNPQGKVPTPNIDRLAREGMRFTDAHTPVALYNLDDDLVEQKNLIDDAEQADRVQQMERLYRDIRSSKRSVPEVQ